MPLLRVLPDMIPVRYVVRDMFEGVEPSIRTIPILAIFSGERNKFNEICHQFWLMARVNLKNKTPINIISKRGDPVLWHTTILLSIVVPLIFHHLLYPNSPSLLVSNHPFVLLTAIILTCPDSSVKKKRNSCYAKRQSLAQ